MLRDSLFRYLDFRGTRVRAKRPGFRSRAQRFGDLDQPPPRAWGRAGSRRCGPMPAPGFMPVSARTAVQMPIDFPTFFWGVSAQTGH